MGLINSALWECVTTKRSANCATDLNYCYLLFMFLMFVLGMVKTEYLMAAGEDQGRTGNSSVKSVPQLCFDLQWTDEHI